MARDQVNGEARKTSFAAAPIAAAAAPRGLAGPMVVFAIVVAGLYVGREILIPIVVALLLSFVLGALVNLLRRFRLPRIAAIFVSVIIALGIVVTLSGVIGVQIADVAGQAPRYASTVQSKVQSLKQGTIGRMAGYLQLIGHEITNVGTQKSEPATPPTPPQGQSGGGAREPPAEAQKPVLVEVREPDRSALQLLGVIVSPVVQPLTTTGIVFIVLIFVLAQREDLRDRMIRILGSSDLHRTTVAMDDAAKRLSRYFVFQLALNASFGLAIGLGLWAIGVPNPVLWGIFSALMRFVPYIGAFISALLPLALAAAVDPGWTMVILTAGLFVVLETLVGQVIEPLVYGHSTGLSPFAVLVSALFWTWLWGPIGLLLSTPLTVCLVVLGRHVKQLEFVAVLFGDQPALTPVENFYQRLLADDADEAQEQAVAMLKEHSLSTYYDTVVLKGLELASVDARRGALADEQLTRVRAVIGEMIVDLEEEEDVTPVEGLPLSARFLRRRGATDEAPPPEAEAAVLPAPWAAPGAVLCVAGRGPLDESAAALLAQLLQKHGFGARVVPYLDVSRTRLAELETDAVRMVCIVHLDMVGAQAHLRFLVQRLRRRIPEAAILVGFWPEDEVEAASRAVGELEIESAVRSLKEAVEACARLATRPPSQPGTRDGSAGRRDMLPLPDAPMATA